MPRTAEDCGGILVLGMHRSGTSCLAGSLQRRGLHLGEVQEANPHNRLGNRESLRIMRLNESVLGHSGGAWNEPPERVAWSSQHARERDLVIETLRRSGRPWGFKDPRTILILPFWLERLGDPRFTATFRHPACVAQSLHKRNGMPPGEAFVLWHAYNRLILDQYERHPFPLLSFDQEESDYRAAVDAAARALGLPGLRRGDEDFFDPGLRGVREDHLAAYPEVPSEFLRFHDELLDASRVGAR